MKEIGPNLSVAEISAAVAVGIILIAFLILLLGADVIDESERDNRKEFVKKLKEKEKKLQEKEEKLKKIEEQLRGMR